MFKDKRIENIFRVIVFLALALYTGYLGIKMAIDHLTIDSDQFFIALIFVPGIFIFSLFCIYKSIFTFRDAVNTK